MKLLKYCFTPANENIFRVCTRIFPVRQRRTDRRVLAAVRKVKPDAVLRQKDRAGTENVFVRGYKSEEDGKGSLGCIFVIILIAAAIFLAIKLGPPYINHYEFKGEMKQAVSRAGAHMMSEEEVKKDLIAVAKKNNIILEEKNIRIARVSGIVEITVEYVIPVDFIIMKRDIPFEAKESSFAM